MSANVADLAPTILAANWTEAGLAIVVVMLRMYTRMFVVRRVGWDDYCMVLALALGLINTSLMTESTFYGLGKHFDTLTMENQVLAMKYDFYLQPFCIMSPAVGRISYAIFILQIIPPHQKRRRYFIWILVALQLVINVLCFSFILGTCRPIAAFYDPRIKGDCWSRLFQQYYGYFQGSWNSVTDLILALFPVTIVWHLKLKTSVRVSLSAIMSLGIFAMIASCIKTWQLKAVGSTTDYTYTTAQLSIWYTLEMYLVIISASIPTLKPLISSSKITRTQGDSYQLRTPRPRRSQYIKEGTGTSRSVSAGDFQKEHLGSQHSQDAILGDPVDGIRKTTKVSVQYDQPLESTSRYEEAYFSDIRSGPIGSRAGV